MDQVLEVMRTARTIRRYVDRPVDEAILARCLEAATWAPSGGNQQPWRFIVLKSAASREVVALAAERSLRTTEKVYGFSRPDPDDDSRRSRMVRAVYELHERAALVPAAVLFCSKPLPESPPLLQGSAVYAAMQNFLLAARAAGLGACVTGWHADGEAELREHVGVPDEWELAALVTVGWPAGHHGPVRRKPVREVAALDQWDQPLV